MLSTQSAKTPSIVSVHPDLIGTLDGYADEVSRFDIECPDILGAKNVTNDLNILKASFLDSAASYWEAKGENFGTSKNDGTKLRAIELDSRETIRALCAAQRAYALGKRLADKTSPETQNSKIYDHLNDDLERDGAATLPSAMQSGWDRAEAALSTYPAKDVADACK
jgi:hypothetical protein